VGRFLRTFITGSSEYWKYKYEQLKEDFCKFINGIMEQFTNNFIQQMKPIGKIYETAHLKILELCPKSAKSIK
jgi:hypothetical protein